MKRTFAAFFSLLLVWQAVISAQTPVAGVERATCACCPCAQTDCCVKQSTPASQPVPAAPARTVFQQQLSILPAAQALWVLPDAGARAFSSSAPWPLNAAGAPLYERNCALLL